MLDNDEFRADLIEYDLQQKMKQYSSVGLRYRFWKRKMLKYRLRKSDWLSYIDRDFSWITAQYALGLLSTGKKRSIKVLAKYYDYFLFIQRLGFPVFEVPDQVFHAEILLELYFKYGKKRFIPLIREAAELLKSISRCNDGLIPYWPPDKAMLVDTLGMITQFCFRYAQQFGDQEMASIAVRQIEYTEKYCIDTVVDLPYHSYNYQTGSTEGSSTWGRGAGWYLVGLTDYSINTGLGRERLWQVLAQIMSKQNSLGFLPNDLKNPSHVDTSITSMAAYSIAKYLVSQQIDGERKSQMEKWLFKSVNALLSVTNETGEVLECSGECQEAGHYSTEYGNYFAQGYTLAALSLMRDSLELQELFGR